MNILSILSLLSKIISCRSLVTLSVPFTSESKVPLSVTGYDQDVGPATLVNPVVEMYKAGAEELRITSPGCWGSGRDSVSRKYMRSYAVKGGVLIYMKGQVSKVIIS